MVRETKVFDEELDKRLEKRIAVMKEFQSEFRKQLFTLVTAAFGFVAALFWNTAIKDMVNAFIPQAQSWIGELVTAIFVTFIAVLIIYFLSKKVENK